MVDVHFPKEPWKNLCGQFAFKVQNRLCKIDTFQMLRDKWAKLNQLLTLYKHMKPVKLVNYRLTKYI